MTGSADLAPPLHIAGPEGPWDDVADALESTGVAVVHTTWGEWLTVTLLDPRLRALLGHDWPRYRQTRAATGRLRFAVSRVVMKYTAAAVLQVPPDTLDVAYKPGGRPQLRGIGEELGLSLAHTDELIVVGVSGTGPIGVDAEPVGRKAPFELLGEYVCTAEEAAGLAALPEAERTLRLLQLWTLKEAYTKALGHGMRRRFAGFGFRRDEEGRIALATAAGDAPAWVFASHLVQGRYLVSAAHRPSYERYEPCEASEPYEPFEQPVFAETVTQSVDTPGFPGRWSPGIGARDNG